MVLPSNIPKAMTLSVAKGETVANTIAQVREFRFRAPPTTRTSKRPSPPVTATSGSAPAYRWTHPSRRDGITAGTLYVEIDNLYSAYDASSEVDALLPDIESALEVLDNTQKQIGPANHLPVRVCSIVGDVLGDYIYHHKTLERLFYEAGAVGDVPPGNCIVKCQSWLRRMHTRRSQTPPRSLAR